MSSLTSLRFEALESLLQRLPEATNGSKESVSSYFGSKVFGMDAMREYLPDDAFESVMNAVQKGERLSRKIADQVASSMKAWSIERGATHYTHWFQPLTGTTAEKHDAFFEPTPEGRAFESFGGNQLVQQEPDASSFPSGGLRNTFEARGYTAWDPTSPAFIIGKTLCIPTIFVSYTGEALDYKTPLLKALHQVDKAATDVCQYFDKNVTKVTATLGWEQEYFLVDSSLFNARPDLALTGRTLFGHASAKDQQLEDHYFGSIPDRVAAFMRDFEKESLMLGIPVKTRHNEVAPNQFECAPVFEECNLAVDHNQLLMDVMEKVARRHNFRVLLHEKPYAGVNGSGKHNNWSLATNTGKNLLSPGSTPKTNLQFLTFFVNTLKAVHTHAGLLRASIASAGNDHRLGANEAPPAIISAFIGSQLTAILDEVVEKVGKGKMSSDVKTELKLNIGKIPDILLDNTDRNRTSPFAFTGNKFELRAVGSSANCASAMTVLNAIMAQQLRDFKNEVDQLIDKGLKKDEAIFKVLRQYIIDSKDIRFEGNGYSDEWVKEAAKRGLANIKTTPEALDAMVTKEASRFFEANDIYSERELHARHEIQLETYTKKIQIESRVMGDLATNHIIPVAIRYQNILLENVRGLKEVLAKPDYEKAAAFPLSAIQTMSTHIAVIQKAVDDMVEARKKANKLTDARAKAIAYCDNVRKYFDVIRYEVDKLELMVDDEMWPLPKYRELLFAR
ncbi:MAG: glutamine synthetase III [Flavobacteriales bacterium]|nr:glutamine synthetase III [Flavobacteriales bacterium]MCB9447438.1 glutamine synthetase III [Flavobacteriales bacterium]